MIYRNIIIIILFLISTQNLHCQTSKDDDQKQVLGPAKAAFYSAVLPGLGQVYNKKYWKVPIVYGALAGGVYYFNKNKAYTPFLGGGLGVYVIGSGSDNIDEQGFGPQIGGMVRGGIELSKFRIALEYNIIPKSDLGLGKSMKNSYFGASIGFYIGGGKWKK